MVPEPKVITAILDEIIKSLTKEFAANSSQWFNMLRDDFQLMDDAQFNSTVKMLLDAAITSGEVRPHINHQTSEQILRGFGELAKAVTEATSTTTYKRMAKSVARYFRYLWGSMNEEAKEIVGFALIAGFEIKPFNPVPIPEQE